MPTMNEQELDQFDPAAQRTAARAALMDCGFQSADEVRAIVRRLRTMAERDADSYLRGFSEARDRSLQIVLGSPRAGWASRAIRHMHPERMAVGLPR